MTQSSVFLPACVCYCGRKPSSCVSISWTHRLQYFVSACWRRCHRCQEHWLSFHSHRISLGIGFVFMSHKEVLQENQWILFFHLSFVRFEFSLFTHDGNVLVIKCSKVGGKHLLLSLKVRACWTSAHDKGRAQKIFQMFKQTFYRFMRNMSSFWMWYQKHYNKDVFTTMQLLFWRHRPEESSSVEERRLVFAW